MSAHIADNLSMGRKLLTLLFLFAAIQAMAQRHDPGYYPDTIRGEVWVELEPIYGDRPDDEYPLSMESGARRALQEAAIYFSGVIYGWSFHYEIGERARGIAEDFDIFEPMGEIPWGDPRLIITESENRDMKLRVWVDYHLSEIQHRRTQLWRTGTIRNAQSTGYCSIQGASPNSGWMDIRKAVLKDAARAAVREILRGSERNRPKEASGYISLASFPRFYLDSGQWAAAARFRIQITEIVPFAAY